MAKLDRLLEQGVAAAKANYKEQAEALLKQVVTIDPGNEQAWLWLSAVVEGIEEKKDCLRRVIEVNPYNTTARSGLRYLSHLREGFEYMANRAPWMASHDEYESSLSDIPERPCLRCGATNPGWAYTCNSCQASLESMDVKEMVKEEIKRQQASRSVFRPWASAIFLDSKQAFAPEVSLASYARSVLVVVLGAIAGNLLRLLASVVLIIFTEPSQFGTVSGRLMSAFIADQALLLLGALAAWGLLGAVTRTLAGSMGGMGYPRIHYYMMAVAVSAWTSVAGLVTVIWTAIAVLVPGVSPELLVALASGLLMFYAVTLIGEAIHAAHGLEHLQETGIAGVVLMTAVVIYSGLMAILPPGMQMALFKVLQVVLMPILP
jgi:hypothetical protein